MGRNPQIAKLIKTMPERDLSLLTINIDLLL